MCVYILIQSLFNISIGAHCLSLIEIDVVIVEQITKRRERIKKKTSMAVKTTATPVAPRACKEHTHFFLSCVRVYTLLGISCSRMCINI